MTTISISIVFGVLIFMVAVMSSGIPIPFALGGSSIIALMLFWGPSGYFAISSSIWATFTSDNFIAIPMFLLMANVLEKSGIAEDMYSMLYQWMGALEAA